MSEGAFESLDAALRERLDRLPREPGVYLLHDRAGEIIYVGKAKSLYARVRSYFTRSGDERAFVPLLAHILGDVETIVTQNEKEALLLENNLIKQHKPRFNVMMRDDKNFLVLRLDTKQEFPRLEIMRRIGEDGARYFGPYHSASSCRETLRVVNRYFRLRTCSDRALETRTRACLQYQIGRCPAPCVLDVEPTDYRQQIEDVTLFLRGRGDELLRSLRDRMQEAAGGLAFELAAHLRDQIQAVERSLERQEVVGSDLSDQDVFAYDREGAAVDISVLVLRGGKLLGRTAYSFNQQEFPAEELLSSFINLYYDGGAEIPRQVLVALPLEDAQAKAQWLSELAGHKVGILVPQRGHKRQLVELATRNAQSNFETRRRKDADVEAALTKLRERLRLSRLPRHIECYDISHFQGQQVVASMVVLRDGEPDSGAYRHFTLRSKANDDFSSLYEVVARRLRRARQGDAGWQLPDLLVIDGGKGQLSSVLAALRDADFPADVLLPDVVSLAKERVGEDASGAERPDRVFIPHVKDPLRLRPNTAELFLLSRVRDEAHRFAITQHKRKRRKQTLRSSLDDIPGIGKARKARLLRSLGSLRAIQGADVETLRMVPGMNQRAAEAVVSYFRARPNRSAPSAEPSPTVAERGDDDVNGVTG